MRQRPVRPTNYLRSLHSDRCRNLQHARVARLRAQMEFARSRGGDTGAPPVSEAASQLLDAAKRLENLDDDLARETYLEAHRGCHVRRATRCTRRTRECGRGCTRRGRPGAETGSARSTCS